MSFKGHGGKKSTLKKIRPGRIKLNSQGNGYWSSPASTMPMVLYGEASPQHGQEDWSGLRED